MSGLALSRSNSESARIYSSLPPHLLSPPSLDTANLSNLAPPSTSSPLLGPESNASSVISRQSSCRSTSSVSAVPFKVPVRGKPKAVNSNVSAFTSSPADSPVLPSFKAGGADLGGGGGYFARGLGVTTNGLSTPGSAHSGSDYPSSATASAAGSRGSVGTFKAAEETNVISRPQSGVHAAGGRSMNNSPMGRPGLGERLDSGALGGRKTVEDFKWGEILGEGSYSTVTHVTSLTPPYRSYALKQLDKEHIKREKKTKYVLIERDTLKLLDGGRGIIRLFWTFQDSRSLYYVLELAENGELLKWIKKLGSFSLPCARYYAAQILSAVEYMHSKGVIHRDLKPENILLSQDMKIKITDFGTARVINLAESAAIETVEPDKEIVHAKMKRSFVGTPEYVSPEILSEKKESSKSSDYWAFGCILYQILAGHPPFQARTEYLVFQKIIHLDYEFPEGFPPLARDLIEKLLVLDPEERLGGTVESGGVEAIKSHPFFTATTSSLSPDMENDLTTSLDPIDFDNIWNVDAPVLETGLVGPKTEERGEFVLMEDEFDDDDDGDDEHYTAGEVVNTQVDTVASKWSPFLNPHESVILHSTVIDRSSSSVFTLLSSRRRILVLTTDGRLLSFKETNRLSLKNEILLNRAGVTVQMEGDKGLAVRNQVGKTFKYDLTTVVGSGAEGVSVVDWFQEIDQAIRR